MNPSEKCVEINTSTDWVTRLEKQCFMKSVFYSSGQNIDHLHMLSGHISICNYLLNYYPSLDLERKNCHGFTALMKAAMQGRIECVRTLMFAGTVPKILGPKQDGSRSKPKPKAK